MTSPSTPAARYWEIDAARGVAVIAMVFFHLMWDLQFLGMSNVNVFSTPWQTFARGIGSSFAFLMGLSLTLVAARYQTWADFWTYVLWRGGLVFGLGMLVTLVTLVALGEQYVRFGILHLLGSMLVLAAPFVSLPVWRTLTVGLLMIVLGALLTGQTASTHVLLPLGVPPRGVVMADYYPLLPWGGVTLLGVAFGRLGYPDGQRRVVLPALAGVAPLRVLRFLGRHSLPIYLLHQPVLLGMLIAVQALR